MTTDRTALRERLIAIIKGHRYTGIDYDDSRANGLADAIMVEFPQIIDPEERDRLREVAAYTRGVDDGRFGQPPRLDPALRKRIEEAINLVAYAAVYDIDKYSKRKRQVMALIDSIAPAAQPQIDREALARLICQSQVRSISTWDKFDEGFRNIWRNRADFVIAHLNATPAAHPLPTRGQLRKLDYGHRESLMMPPHVISALIAAGYAREDEPESQVVEMDEVDVVSQLKYISCMEFDQIVESTFDQHVLQWAVDPDGYQTRDFSYDLELRLRKALQKNAALVKAVSERGDDAS